MAVDLFPTNPNPANPGNTGATTSVGYKWKSSVDGTCTGIKFHINTGQQTTRSIGIYLNSGSLLVSLTGGTFSVGWNTYSWATPISITAGTLYCAVIYSSAGDICGSYSTMSVDRTNDVLTAPANNSGGQYNGVWAFSVGSMSLPANTDTTVSPTWFVSPVFEAHVPRPAVIGASGAAHRASGW